MTEAGWTRATDVTQPGWYWLRRVGSLAVVEVIAVPGYEPKHWIVEGVNLRWSLGNMDGEFLGPISPDSYQQGRVEGLREYREVVARELQLDHSNHPTRFKASIIEALDKADFEVSKQAAQDEKGVGDGNTKG